jgi:hypothetical protein
LTDENNIGHWSQSYPEFHSFINSTRDIPMKLITAIVPAILLMAGCANFPGTGTTGAEGTDNMTSAAGDETLAEPAKPVTREREVNIGNWRVDCLYEEITLLTQCKAETWGKLLQYLGDEITGRSRSCGYHG